MTTATKETTMTKKDKDKPEYDPPLTLSEVARMCGKHPNTIKRWCIDGLLEAVRLPSGLLGVKRSQVMAFLGASALNVKEHD